MQYYIHFLPGWCAIQCAHFWILTARITGIQCGLFLLQCFLQVFFLMEQVLTQQHFCKCWVNVWLVWQRWCYVLPLPMITSVFMKQNSWISRSTSRKVIIMRWQNRCWGNGRQGIISVIRWLQSEAFWKRMIFRGCTNIAMIWNWNRWKK